MGSWTFIIAQSVALMFWIALNVTAYVQQWDPYPFILLNLALSFQAAYAAPFIMMSQNRQQDIDRKSAENDYQINIKAELEIELLHQKIDQLRETEVLQLTLAVNDLTGLLRRAKIEPGFGRRRYNFFNCVTNVTRTQPKRNDVPTDANQPTPA